MAGTNITNLLEIIQRKIDAADASTATQDLLYLLSAVRQGDGSALELYDSSGAFPDLTDSAADTEMIAYKGDSDRLYFNVGVWKGKSLPAGGGAAAYSFQGSNYGYASGGGFPPSNIIDKFPFSSDANATDVGDLTVVRANASGQTSSDNGYTSGGRNAPGTDSVLNIIDKFPFAADANATDVGDLTIGKYGTAGQSSSTHGYVSGGRTGVPVPAPPASINEIEKFPFASDANATDVGDLTVSRRGSAGQSSADNGYTSGGTTPGASNVIDKFPFAADTNASDVGNLTVGRYFLSGQSSSENGYNSGGIPPASNIIDKFSFASDANATDVGDLLAVTYGGAGQSSTVSGYHSGGSPSPTGVIQKFSFSVDGNSTDVGDLTVGRYYPAGTQY